MSKTTRFLAATILALWSLVEATQLGGQVPILTEDFEGTFPGSWAVGDADPAGSTAYWGKVDLTTFGSPPWRSPGGHAAYCAGVGFAGSTAIPSYRESMNAYMRRSLNLTAYSSARLSFWYVLPSVETCFFDYCDYLAVVVDGTDVFITDESRSRWGRAEIDLSPYVGSSHTLTIQFVADGSISYEGAYVDDILISGTPIIPNLAPYQPPNWSDKIVVSKSPGVTEDTNPLTAVDILYLNWAVINNGSTQTPAPFSTQLYIDGVLLKTWTNGSAVDGGSFTSVQDYVLGTLASGTHSLKIKADAGASITEASETDNEYTKTIVVGTYPVSTQWEGMGDDLTTYPPDPHGAAGPAGVIQSVNTRIAYYDKAGALLWGPVFMGDFWAGVGNTATGISDPKVLYDVASSRFYVILQETLDTQSFLNVAVSKGNNPLSGGVPDWYFYRFEVTETLGSTNYGGDYPCFGLDSQAVYVTLNMYPLPDLAGAPKHTQIIIMDKAALASGTGSALHIDTPDANAAFTLQPVTPIGAGGPSNRAYFVETLLTSSTAIRIWSLSNPLGVPTLNVVAVGIPDNGGAVGSAPQAGTGLKIDTAGRRAQGTAFWFQGAVWFCQTAGGSSGKSKVFYYKVNANNFPIGTPTLAESGSLDGGPGIWTYQPAIGGNDRGEVCLVYCQSSTNTYPSIMFTARVPGAAGFASPSALKVSPDFYNSTFELPDSGRWGDFGTVAADPIDGTFWISHEWSRSSAPEDWGTWWGHLPLIGLADSVRPSVSITNPVTAQAYTNVRTVTISAKATDNVGVGRVEFYDGGSLRGKDLDAPYTVDWALTTAENGAHIWTTRCYDTSGNIATSSPVTLTVSIDLVAPVVVLSSPTNGANLVVSNPTITGTASDPGSPSSGVGVVEVRVNGGNWQPATGTAAWSRSVVLAPCNNTIEARSADKAGNLSGIAEVAVFYAAPNTPPGTPTNVTPANGSALVSLTPLLQASAFIDTDCVGDLHASSQWQVLSGVGATVVADSGTDTVNKVAWTVPANKLSYGSNYQWRVRYRDSRTGWSSNSVPTTFTTVGPVLTETKTGTNVALRWPTSAPGFLLQWSPRLPATNWSNATPAPIIVGGQYSVTNNFTNQARFYRLRK